MSLNLSMSEGDTQFSPEMFQQNLTSKGNISTSSIKNSHNSNPTRFENLRCILNAPGVQDKLKEKGITLEENGDFCFDISITENETISVQIRNMSDFYRMLRKHKNSFLESGYDEEDYIHGNNYELSEEDSQDSILFGMFLEEYTGGEYYNEFETERGKIDKYREDRMQAIEDTLSHSGEFISGRNAKKYGKTPFYNRIKDNPKLRKKAILFAEKCADTPKFVEFINKISEGTQFMPFCNFLDGIKLQSIGRLSYLFQNPKFVTLYDILITNYPNHKYGTSILQKIVNSNGNLTGLLEFLERLEYNGITNFAHLLTFREKGTDLQFKTSFLENILEHDLESFLNRGEARSKEEIGFVILLLNNDIGLSRIKHLLGNLSKSTIKAVYYYVTEEAEVQEVFITNLLALARVRNISNLVKWLESSEQTDGTSLEQKLFKIEKDFGEVANKLTEGLNPIGVKGIFGRMKYEDL